MPSFGNSFELRRGNDFTVRLVIYQNPSVVARRRQSDDWHPPAFLTRVSVLCLLAILCQKPHAGELLDFRHHLGRRKASAGLPLGHRTLAHT